MTEHPGIRGDIGVGSATDGGLIDEYYLVQLFGSIDFSNFPDRNSISGTELVDEVRCEYVHNEGRLS